MRILTEYQENLLNEERNLLSDLRVALVKFGATEEDQVTLAESLSQLDEFFLLVVVGEFNAGKSALINALLGQQVLKEGVTPTTTQINMLRFGATNERVIQSEHLHILTSPVDLLEQLSIVDTPGTNAIIREHELITTQFLPKADLVLFITSADRPFTESERAFLEQIRDWGKKVLIIINKIDILQDSTELDQIRIFVADNAHSLLGISPEIFPVSARLALKAKTGEPEYWQRSGFESLENYIKDTLDEEGKIRLKFLNPLGVGQRLVERYLKVTDERLDLLSDDTSVIEDVERQLNLYQEDMQRNFDFRLSDLENILYELESRGNEYFDEMLRLGRVFDLLKKERVQRAFEQKVVADTPQKIEQKVNELVDWLVESDLRQWQAVNDHLAERKRQHKDRIIGDVGIGSFHYDRGRLIDKVSHEAQQVVQSYDKRQEAQLIAEGAQNAVAAAAALEVSAIGLGAIVTAIATTVAADVTGILVAGLIAALGLFVIPARRRQARSEMHAKVTTMREKLIVALKAQFEHEIDRSLHNINEAIAPYTRFVRGEKNHLQEASSELERLRNDILMLRMSVEEP